MRTQPNRREILVSAGAAAAGALLNPRVAAGEAAGRPEEPRGEYKSVGEQLAALADRKVSAVELVDRAIARVESLDGRINAVVVRDFDRARAAALEADKARSRGERRPLLGIPMTVKESHNVAGLPTTWGIVSAKGWQAREDAVAIARLKAAGAIVIGKTNVPLMLSDWQSYNDVYGTTNNPWDLGRTPGGSSGGAAASLAAGYVALEFGSDIAGSLRAPAHFCGVFGHKPSHGLVPSRGHAPPNVPALPYEVDLAVVGPMARSAGDLALALDVVAGPDEPLAVAYRLGLPSARHDELKDFRVLVIDEHPLVPTSGAVKGALDRLTEGLTKRGTRIARKSPLLPDLALAGRTYTRLLMSVFGADFPIEVYGQLQGVAASLPPEAGSLEALRVRGLVLGHRDWMKADRVRAAIAQQWRDLFREWDVVLCPAMPTTAFAHDHSEMRTRRIAIDGKEVPYADQAMWPGMATLTGLPATAMPIGLAENLPVGMQIIGPYLEDRTPLKFAQLVEREFGGFVAPPGF